MLLSFPRIILYSEFSSQFEKKLLTRYQLSHMLHLSEANL
jgi:hypothetical protein